MCAFGTFCVLHGQACHVLAMYGIYMLAMCVHAGLL